MKNYKLKGYGEIFVAETEVGDDFLEVPKDSDIDKAFEDAIEYVTLFSNQEMQLKFQDGFTFLIYPGMSSDKLKKEYMIKIKHALSKLKTSRNNNNSSKKQKEPEF